eukprot:7446206-Prorocentrum_lima.AAC.1
MWRSVRSCAGSAPPPLSSMVDSYSLFDFPGLLRGEIEGQGLGGARQTLDTLKKGGKVKEAQRLGNDML